MEVWTVSSTRVIDNLFKHCLVFKMTSVFPDKCQKFGLLQDLFIWESM